MNTVSGVMAGCWSTTDTREWPSRMTTSLKPQMNLAGYRYYLDRSAIEFTVIENFLNMDNSTDIAFTLGYRHML